MSEHEFTDVDLSGATFEHVDLAGARFRRVRLGGARIENADLTGLVLRDVDLVDVEITGELRGVVVNGVEIDALVEAELDRRDPERVHMRPTDADGFRRAWDLLEQRWGETVERARRLGEDRLHESVDDEWSFVQTLRHLVFATDTWVLRVIDGDPRPWDQLSLPFDQMAPDPEVPWDRDARPPLDEVLALRRTRTDRVRRLLDDLSDARLDEHTEPVEGPGWPPPDRYPVRECLLTVLNEEWEHRRYAERDLAALEAR